MVAYGFLRIPAFDDMQVQLKPGTTPVVVDEDASVSFDAADYVDLIASDAVEVWAPASSAPSARRRRAQPRARAR